MSITKETNRLGLIATEISFTDFAIVYKVRCEEKYLLSGVVFCNDDIKTKDLILKPTLVDKDNMEVVFVPGNVIPQFYQNILDESIRGVDEYRVEINHIYNIGDIVGYILK